VSSDVFSHPWLGGLFADAELAGFLSADSQLEHMLAVETAFSQALGSAGVVSEPVAKAAVQAIAAASVDMDQLRRGTARDGVVVPELVRMIRAGADKKFHPAIHVGLTSQDVVDTALVLALVDVCRVLGQRLDGLGQSLDLLIDQHGHASLMGRTRMQAAMPIKVRDRLRNWREPLIVHSERLAQIKPRMLQLQFGGAVGDRVELGSKGDAVALSMAETLGLGNPPSAWHTRRDNIAEFASLLSLITGTLAKMGQDIALMAQQGVDEITLTGGGGSSAMPHKNNPVQAELLVTLGRFNAVQLAGMHQALIHEQERSGAAWALEWMILPQMIMATGCSLLTANALCGQISRIGEAAG